MTLAAVLFMAGTWGLVSGVAGWCLWRLLRS